MPADIQGNALFGPLPVEHDPLTLADAGASSIIHPAGVRLLDGEAERSREIPPRAMQGSGEWLGGDEEVDEEEDEMEEGGGSGGGIYDGY